MTSLSHIRNFSFHASREGVAINNRSTVHVEAWVESRAAGNTQSNTVREIYAIYVILSEVLDKAIMQLHKRELCYTSSSIQVTELRLAVTFYNRLKDNHCSNSSFFSSIGLLTIRPLLYFSKLLYSWFFHMP